MPCIDGVYSNSEVRIGLKNLIDKMRNHMSMSPDLTLVRISDDLVIHTQFQALFNDKSIDRCEKLLHEVVMMHAVAAEKMGPGGFDACINLLIHDLTAMIHGQNLSKKHHSSEQKVARNI